MMKTILQRALVKVLFTMTAAATVAVPASAQELASAWNEALNARARLIAGAGQDDRMLVGVEIDLAEKWKTYWRNPGDAGIPPLFDFSGSKNVAATEVAFPVPHRFPDPAGESIGYKNKVIFPVTVRPDEPGKPVELSLRINYAVCEVLCIPVEQDFTLNIPANAAAAPAALTPWLAAIPSPAKPESLPRIAGVDRMTIAGKQKLVVQVLHADSTKVIDLFAEGPSDWYLPLPKETARATTGEGLLVSYELDLASLPASTPIADTAMTFTMVTGEKGSEQVVRLP